MEYKSWLKKLLRYFEGGYNSSTGIFISLLFSIILVSSLNGIELKEIKLVTDIILIVVFIYSIIGSILISYYLFPNLEEKNRKELFNPKKKNSIIKKYKNLLVISFNLLILTPIIIILIFNSNGIFNLSFNIISTIDSDLIIAASVLLIAVQFSEQNYLDKVKMFPKEYSKLSLSNNNNYLKNAIFTIIFAILSLEIVSQNINIVFQNAHINVAVNIAISVMLLSLYFVFSAFVDILYIEKIRQLNKKLYNN